MNTRAFRVLSGLSLLIPILLGGCRPSAPTSSPEPPSAVGKHANESSDTKLERPSGSPVEFASKGVPHGAPITLIALDPEAKAALSRDMDGSVRFWPALDGSREPLVVPIRDPQAMALGSDGAGGWVLALLDAAGGARLVGVDPGGVMSPLASLPPTDPITDVAILPGAAQVLVVGSDHVIRLLDRHGTELARLDTPGLRPASLRLATEADNGPRVIAVTAGEFDDDHGRFAVEMIALEVGPDSLALGALRQTIHLDAPPSADNPKIAPDGRTAVFLQRARLGPATWKVVATQLADGRSVSVDSEAQLRSTLRFGLLPDGRVLLDDGSGLGRIVDLRERQVELVPLRSSPTINHIESTFAGGMRVAPSKNWLAVHDLASDDLRYLGYDQISVVDAGMSPSGGHVAWALSDRVAVEALPSESSEASESSGEVFEIPGTRAHGKRFIEFLDEELLLTLDWSGGAQLIRWRDGEVVSAADLGNHVQSATLARDGRGNGAMLVRTNLWKNPTVVELNEREIGRHYLTRSTGNLAGLLAPSDRPVDAWGAWVLDAGGTLQTFSIARLREGLVSESTQDKGERLSFGMPKQFAIDSVGQRFWVQTVSRPILHVDRGAVIDEVALAPGPVALLVPSRDARRIAVVQQRDTHQLLTVFDSATLQPMWAQPIPPITGLAWSDAGDRLAVPASLGGGAVFDGADGTPVTLRCGLAFEVRRSPPINQGFSKQRSLCDR